MTTGVLFALITTLLFLFFLGFISVAEAAFFSISTKEKEELSNNKDVTDCIVYDLLSRPDYLSAAILILNCFTTVFVIVLVFFVFERTVDFSQTQISGFVCEVVVLSFLVLLFGKILPKMIAENSALMLARKAAPIFNGLEALCRPLSSFFVKSSDAINKSVGIKNDLSVAELSKALELTSNEISGEKEILEGIIKLYKTTAVEIMTSRLDVLAIDIKSNFRKVIACVVETGYSRIPVYSENFDNIKGILYIKDLLPFLNKSAGFRWQTLIRPAYFVPETKKIDDLLEEFKINKIHFSVVVDEFGGASGIVTLEDILEEIVGEIEDEYDEADSKYTKLEDGSYVFEAKILLTDFFKITGLDARIFEKLTDEVDTLAGLVLELKGDFPEIKEVLEYNDYVFQVLDINKRRILKVRFFIKNQESAEEPIE